MIVGEAPGQIEEKEGRPFVGPAGKMLRSFLMQAGIDPDDCYLTNICKYRPPGNKLATWFDNKGRPYEVVVDGMLELQNEIDRVRPNVIIAAGNFPMWALTGKGDWSNDPDSRGYRGITKWRGSILPCTLVGGFKVIPTFHPSYINQEGYADHGTWLVDLLRIARESAFPEIRRPVKDVVIDPTIKQRIDFLGQVEEARQQKKILTFDIEYVGSKLLCVGMTLNRDNPHVVVTRNSSDIQYVRDILTSGIRLNAQNAMYDCSQLEWWYQMAIMQYMIYDTMICQYAANIELPKGLDYLTSIYTDEPFYKDMVDWDLIKKGKQDLATVWHYNGKDTWTQHQVMEDQWSDDLEIRDPAEALAWLNGEIELKDHAVRDSFSFGMQLLNPLWDISKRGVRVDRQLMRKLEEELDTKMAEDRVWLQKLNGGKPLNEQSNPQVAQFLYGRMELPVIKMNETGPACDDKTLAELLGKATHPMQQDALTLLRSIRTGRALKSKFIGIELDDDGRMRGHYNPARTDTGRLASTKFGPTGRGANQQNYPRDKRVRKCFRPDRGKKFGYADLERAESLVVAHITGDPEMLRVHQPGVDAHRELASELFGVPVSQVTDDQRYLGKKTRHAGNYMQGPKRFMMEINKDAHKTGVSIDFEEAKHYIAVYRKLHEQLPVWWKETENQLWSTHRLYNLLGRQRTFYDRVQSCLPEAVAFVPQSTVGDTLNVGLLQLSGVESKYARKAGIVEAIPKHLPVLRAAEFEILMQIHDAVAFQYLPEYEEEVAIAVRELMRVPLWVSPRHDPFEIPVEIQLGESWGEVKVWHEKKAA
jgi:uracil-DNA glycosylase family 4